MGASRLVPVSKNVDAPLSVADEPPQGSDDAWGWVRGVVDADYHGSDVSPLDIPWSSAVHIVRAHLSDVERVDGPPEEGKETLRQATVEPAWIELEGTLLPVTLYDVHIQAPTRVAAIVRDTEADVVGRLTGRIWARLGHPPPPPSPPPASESTPSLRGAADPAPTPATPDGPADSDASSGDAYAESPGPTSARTGEPSTSNDLGPDGELAVDGELGLDGEHGADWDPFAGWDVRADEAEPPTSPSVEVPGRESAEGCGSSLGCGCLPILGLLTFLILLASCGLQLALLWLIVIGLGFMGQRHCEQHSHPRGCLRWAVSWSIVAAHIVLLGVALWDIGLAPCDPRSLWLLLLLALPVIASAAVPSRLLLTTTSMLWSIGLLVWCTRADELCLAGDDVAASESPVTRAIERTARELETRFEEVVATDEVARLLAENTDRISIDHALLDPDLFFGECGQKVVLSGDILFGHDSDQLDPAAEPHLRKLRRLLALRPDTRILIVGHADPTGNPAYNVDLSQRRAGSVAAWLLQNGGISVDRIEQLGRGSEDPVVSDPELLAINRRVEVSIVCD